MRKRKFSVFEIAIRLLFAIVVCCAGVSQTAAQQTETVTIHFVVEVRDRDHLAQAVRVVRRMGDVLKVVRTIAGQKKGATETNHDRQA